MSKNAIRPSRMVTAIAAAFVTGATWMPQVAVAQEEDGTKLDKLVITGSRIQRDEFASSSPISTFTREDIEMSGVVSVDEFLKNIPAFTGYQMNTSTNNGSAQGQKKVDLRGLGFNRTLVLINGRRQIGDVNGDGAVDLNTVPLAIVDRIEVLKDGASTIYGSDALAGVVNIILRKDYEGVSFSVDHGFGMEDGQADNKGWSVVGGANSARGSFLMSLSYSEQKEMKQAERKFAENELYPLLQNGQFVPVASGSSNSRRIRVDLDQNGSFESSRIVDAGTGQARPFTPSDVYNFAPVNALITPNETWQMSALGNLKLNEYVDGYFETLFTRRTSAQRLAPDASFAVTSSFPTPNNGPQWNDFVPADNPHNPYGVNPRNPDGASNQDVRINRRFVESGGRRFIQGSDTFRMVYGLKGDLFSGEVLWDLSYTFAQNELVDDTRNYGRFDRWATAVDPTACAADTACSNAFASTQGALNPFDDYGTITPAQMSYLSTGSLKDVYRAELNLLSLNLTGNLPFSFDGGLGGWAAGIERRSEEGSFSPDEFAAEGLTTSGASDPQEGRFIAEEVYGEVFLPILDAFSIDASIRHSRYDNSAGDATTYKLGAEFAPIDELKFRAGYATGFRAPNITELNAGDATGFPIVEPLCEFADRRLAAGDISQTAYDNCVTLAGTDGVDTTDAGEYGFAWQSAYTITAPTQPLKPEESTSYHMGVVWEPEFLEGLTLSMDYWDIEVENVIGNDDINDLMLACMNSPNFTAAACSAFVGTTPGQPYDGPFPADATSAFGNLGTLRTAGIDFNAFYEGRLDLGLIDRYHLVWGATFLDTYERQFPLAGSRELAGTANGFAVFPEWRWNSEVGVKGANWTAAFQTQYIGETEDALRPASITNDAKAEAVFYHDLVGTYTWKNVKFSAGINNLLDEDPPGFHSAFNAETEPGTYDVIGRRMFTQVKIDF